jgi:hypothetical protein
MSKVYKKIRRWPMTADNCSVRDCRRVAYDDCEDCGEAFCLRHGVRIGDVFLCHDCKDAREDDDDED